MPTTHLTSDFSRVFMLTGTAGPATAPEYQGLWKAGTPSFANGDITTIRIPDPDRYGQFLRVGKILGEAADPELPIVARYTSQRSELLRLARNGCDHDVQVHIGECQSPKDFNGGWDKILVIESARIQDWTTDNDLGALGEDERNIVNEEVTFIGQDLYEIVKIKFTELAASQVAQEIVDIIVCDQVSCGTCGITSDGCDKVFAIQISHGGSPGFGAEVIYSDDGGGSWGETHITTMAPGEAPNALACVGSSLVVISEDSESIHYADLAEILAGTETWAEVTDGFVATKGPLAIFSLGPSQTWIVAEGGYVYFTSNLGDAVEVQDAGVATAQNLNAVHAFDTNTIVAVGASNAVVRSLDGGITWGSVVGPAVGVSLTAVWARSADEWFVGTAGGELYYTRDGGATWTLKGFPGSGSGVVRDIAFSSRQVGWLAHDTATPAGRILRTISGGHSWYVAPESTGSIPENDRINALAPCADVNILFAGGLAGDGSDGFVVKGS